MKDEKLSITNYYWPFSDSDFKLQRFNIKRIGRPRKIGFKFDDGPLSEVSFGIADCVKNKKQYEDLIRKYRIAELSNKEIYTYFWDQNQFHDDNVTPEIVMDKEPEPWEILSSDDCLSIIYLRLYSRWSLSSLKSKFHIDQETLNNIFRTF